MKTFPQLAPKWNVALTLFQQDGKLEYLKYVMEHKLDIDKANMCIVGEAHGFKMYYFQPSDAAPIRGRCDGCRNISQVFQLMFRGNAPNKDRLKDIEETKDTFVNHWNEEHVKH